MVDSFCSFTCSPKFREAFEVHRLYEKFTDLRSDYETSQQYRNWLASGQNDGKNFFPNFQNQKPLHVMLHVFLERHELSGCALSRVDETYTFDSASSGIEELLPGSKTKKSLDPDEFRRQHSIKRKVRKDQDRNTTLQSTPKRSRLVKKIRDEIRSVKAKFEVKSRECEIQDARFVPIFYLGVCLCVNVLYSYNVCTCADCGYRRHSRQSWNGKELSRRCPRGTVTSTKHRTCLTHGRTTTHMPRKDWKSWK